MHQSVRENIIGHLTWFEGRRNWMYLDSIGLVTTGIGTLLDPFEKYGSTVTWYKGSRLATPAEVRAEFDLVKSKRGADGKPLPAFRDSYAFKPITTLRASDADIDKVTMKIVEAKERSIRQYFGSDYDRWPADVQVVLIQMAYAGGLERRKLSLAGPLKRRDWLAARSYAYLSNPIQGRAGYTTYNLAFSYMLLSAFIVDRCSKQSMFWPTPKDPTQFFGLPMALYLARWYFELQDANVRTDDVVTYWDMRPWLRQQLHG